MLPKRPRLKDFDYVGRYRYFLTFCTKDRANVFVSDPQVTLVWSQILRASAEREFEVIAHVLMPDHVHLLVGGKSDTASLRSFASLAKQRAAFEYTRLTARELWQPSYYDHVLRIDESTLPFVRFILENPVAAGLVDRCEVYPYLGTGAVPVLEMLNELNEAGVDVWHPPEGQP